MSRKLVCAFLLLGCALGAAAQADSTQQKNNKHTKLFFRRQFGWMSYEERALQLWTGAQVGQTVYPQLGFAYVSLVAGEYGGSSGGLVTNLEYSPDQKTWGVRTGLFANVTVLIAGVNIGLSSVRYQREQQAAWGMRPELGLGFHRVWLNYGYNFMFGNRFDGINRGMVTLSAYLPIVPWRVRRINPYTNRPVME